jgi:hypothetical protein
MTILAIACRESPTPFVWESHISDHAFDENFSIAVDNVGNIFIATGTSPGPGEPAPRYSGRTLTFTRVRKFDTNGHELWATDLHLEGDDTRTNDVAVDAQGGVVVVGSSPPWIARLDAEGVPTTPPVRVSIMTSVSAIALDKDGNVVIAGTALAKSPVIRAILLLANYRPRAKCCGIFGMAKEMRILPTSLRSTQRARS